MKDDNTDRHSSGNTLEFIHKHIFKDIAPTFTKGKS